MAYTYEDKLNFIASIYCSVRKIAFKKDVSWETILAQAAQETGWGEKILAGTNNVFNIKADSGWKGPKSKHLVWEDKPNGKRVQEYHYFRNYKDFDEAIEDRIKFLEENPRYNKFFSNGVRGIFEREAQALEDAGYATHKEKNENTGKFELVYADKLIEVFKGPSMRRAIAKGESNGQCTIVNAVFLDDDNSKEINKKVEILIDGNVTLTKTTDSNAIIKGMVVKPNGIIIFKKDNITVSAKIPSAQAPLNIKVNKATTPISDKLDQHNGNPSTRNEPTVQHSEQNPTRAKRDNDSLASFKIKFIESDTNKSIGSFSYGILYKNRMKEHVTDSSGEEHIRGEAGQKIEIYVKDFSGKLNQKIEEFNIVDNVSKTIKVPIREIKVGILNHSSTKFMQNYNIISEYRGVKKEKYTNKDGIITLKGLAGYGVKLTIPSGQIVLPETFFDSKVTLYKRALFEKYENPISLKDESSQSNGNSDTVVSKNKTAPITQQDVRGNSGHPIKLIKKEGTFEIETYLDTTKAITSNLSYEIVYKGKSRIHISGSDGRKLHKCELNEEISVKYKSGNNIVTEKYTIFDNISPIKIYVTKSKGKFNKAIFAKTLKENSTAKSRGLCARYVRLAFEAAGGKVNPRPGSAYQYVSVMSNNNFREMNKDGYTPQIGDIYIIDRFGKHIHGHIAGYDGSQWISDFRQNGINIYRGGPAINYKIFRYYD